ncbi:MAG: S24 family peptidase [Syntrophorhabdales bacterium]|jgi:phage repressor protein C with HTH and peptisase S24 domain
MWYTEATNAFTEGLDQATFTREFVFIPTVDLKVDSQGDCRPDRTIGMTIAFRHEWIQRKGNPRSMSVMRIQGDSMSPTLQAGDIVLVNHSDRSTNYDGGIYAVAVQGEIMIKRVQTLFPSRQLKLISDNKEYEAFTAGSDDAKVIGKIVWYGREVEPVWGGDSGLVQA